MTKIGKKENENSTRRRNLPKKLHEVHLIFQLHKALLRSTFAYSFLINCRKTSGQMNCAFPEMLRCFDNAGSITGNGEMGVFSFPIQVQGSIGNNGDQGLSELVSGRAMKQDPCVDTDWVLSYGNVSEFEMGCVVPRTASSVQPAAAEVVADVDPAGAFFYPEMLCSAVGKDCSKKRKAETIENFMVSSFFFSL